MAEKLIETCKSRLCHLPGVRIISTGSYVPENIIRNEDLASLGYDADWILQRTGIRERRHAPPEMATSDMAVIAAQRCLEKSGRSAEEVDLVVLGTFTADLHIDIPEVRTFRSEPVQATSAGGGTAWAYKSAFPFFPIC